VIREVVRPDFAAQTGLEERYQSHHRAQREVQARPRQRHLELLKTPLQPRALEELDRTGAYYGLETRFPFWDRQLLVFCLSLPTRFKRRHGTERWVLRKAMQNLLPEDVRCRTDKTDFQHSVRQAMQRAHDDAHAKWESIHPALASWVDPAAFTSLYRHVMDERAPRRYVGTALQMIGRLLQLGEWRIRL
jgi:asparagine synthase (glutamine-hydrolysing)